MSLCAAVQYRQLQPLPVTELPEEEESSSPAWWSLLSDRRVCIVAAAVGISTSVMAILEPTLPAWLMRTIHPQVGGKATGAFSRAGRTIHTQVVGKATGAVSRAGRTIHPQVGGKATGAHRTPTGGRKGYWCGQQAGALINPKETVNRYVYCSLRTGHVFTHLL